MKIYFLIGQSNTGKDTVKRELLKRMPELQSYVYCTTRPMREGEAQGREYYFKTEEEYMKDLDSSIEHRTYNFNGDSLVAYYSMPKDVDEKEYIVTGTPDMCHSYIRYYGVDIVKPIFLVVSDRERLIRGIKREDSNKKNYKEVARRFADEFREYSEDNVSSIPGIIYIANEDLENCVARIQTIIKKLEEE